MKKKGFTLVELIAVIVILGVILAITLPTVSEVLNSGYKNAYEIDLEALVDGAKSYVLNENVEIKDGFQTVITLSQMKSEKLIGEVLDPKTNEPCDGYVTVTKSASGYIFTPYLMCTTYISDNYGKDDLGLPVIKLFGDNPTSIYTGNNYIDAGATAFDETDGDISDRIVISASINPNKAGEYAVTYNVKDNDGNFAIPVVRRVYVVDKSAPTITLLGTSPITIEGGTTYTDSGATALDDADGNITNKISVTGSVNTNVVGTYLVTYNVKDSSNNSAAPKVRTVYVVDTKAPTIVAKAPNFTITEGDNNAISSTFFNISKNGIQAIESTICSDLSNGNIVVSNSSSLSPGTHTIKCTVTKLNGLSADATTSIVVNPKYVGVPNTTYTPGTSITYGGIEWLVVSDNSDSITLISKNNIITSAYGSNHVWNNSTVKSYLNNTWLNSNAFLLSETQKGGIIYDTGSSSYVRLINTSELKPSLANGSGTNFWTMTASGNNVYYALSNASTSYAKYSATANENGTCYSGTSSYLGSITSNYVANTLNTNTVQTLATPTATEAEKSTTYEVAASGSCKNTYSTGSSSYTYDCNCSSYACGCSSYTCTKTSYSNQVVVAGSACTGSTCTGSTCTGSTCASYSCTKSTCTGSVCSGSACAGSACAGSACIGYATQTYCAAYSNKCDGSNVCTSYNNKGKCAGSSYVRTCSNVCDRYGSSQVCGGYTCSKYTCTKSTCSGSKCGGYACAGEACAKYACKGSACAGSACAGWVTSYNTNQVAVPYNDTCTTCSSTCQSCSTCTGYTTTYSASGSNVNWSRYVVASQTSSMGVRAVITVKKK